MEKDLEIYIIRKNYDFTYEKCDFYINSWGWSQGKLYYEVKHNNVLGIIILNELLRTELTTFFENLDKNYNPERKIIDKMGKTANFTKTFIHKKLKKDFYKK